MPLKININDNSDSATITTIEDGKSVNKTVSLENLIKIFTSLNGVKRDTGYLAANLLREDAGVVCNRAFYFKDFFCDFRVSTERSLSNIIKKDNKYGIVEESGGVIKIPNYHFREMVGVISNSNNDAFSASYYQVYNVMPSLNNTLDDNTKLVRIFCNQFTDRICWPSDVQPHEFLNHKEYKIQSTFVTRYLTSKFNHDLFNPRLDYRKLTVEDLTKFRKFLDEVFSVQDVFDRVRGYSNVFVFLLYYFTSNILGLNPTVLASGHENTLGQFFGGQNRR